MKCPSRVTLKTLHSEAEHYSTSQTKQIEQKFPEKFLKFFEYNVSQRVLAFSLLLLSRLAYNLVHHWSILWPGSPFNPMRTVARVKYWSWRWRYCWEVWMFRASIRNHENGSRSPGQWLTSHPEETYPASRCMASVRSPGTEIKLCFSCSLLYTREQTKFRNVSRNISPATTETSIYSSFFERLRIGLTENRTSIS